MQYNRRMSAHTVLAYRNDLAQFHAFLSQYGFPMPENWRSSQIRHWIAEMAENNLTQKTIHRKVSALRALIRYLRSNGLLGTDPMIKVSLPKIPKKVIPDIPAADLKNMFAFFPWEENPEGQRDKLLMITFYTTGMRLSELISLKKTDIDLKRGTLTVLGKRNKQRVIPLHPELTDALTQYLTAHSGGNFLFTRSTGEPLYPMMVYRLVAGYLRLFSSAMKTSPHVLRHSFATHMLNNGADLLAIKDILGHSSLSATQVYTKNSFEKLKQIHKLHPRS